MAGSYPPVLPFLEMIGSLRIATWLFVSAALAVSATAQVQLVVGEDGKKTIYNIPSRSHTSAGDLSWLAKQRNHRSVYDPVILRYCNKLGVDPVLAKAVIQVESDYDPLCISRRGARGLMQLMPETARRFRVAKIFDPEQNIRGGVEYLAVLLELFRNDLPKALAAYNAGENAVIRYGDIPPYDETITYVKRTLSVYYGKPYGGKAVFFAGGGGPKLKGGFGPGVRAATPISILSAALAASTQSVVPPLRYLGTR
jgi:Transglycosylase SLT domain